MASGTRTTFWWKGNTSPPKNNAQWADMVDEFVKHCIARYGKDEVLKWYFEVWNEPDLQGFWDGTKSQYFEFYKATVQAIKAIDPHLRVGGPATSNYVADGRFDGEREKRSQWTELNNPEQSESLNWRPVWVEQFIEYCHQNKLPIDFISTHPYPTDFALDPGGKGHGLTRHVDATPNDIRLLRKIIDASPYPKAEIHLTEWSSSPSSRDFTHDCLPAAAFVVKTNIESAGLVDSLSYWTFTDVFEEKGAGDSIFHGGFGMINFQGVVKPTFHAYRFLHALGDEIVSATVGGIVTREKKTGRLIALAYHYPYEVKISLSNAGSLASAEKMMHTGSRIPLNITLIGLPARVSVLVETLDSTHGNAVAAWEAMGKPSTPTREQTYALSKAALATKKEVVKADESGRLTLQREMEPWSLVLVEQQ
jgi:xylan 1,4-beta-xylosidase